MNEETRKFFSDAGKKGGNTTKQRHPDHFSRIGKLGMQKRWGENNTKKKSLDI